MWWLLVRRCRAGSAEPEPGVGQTSLTASGHRRWPGGWQVDPLVHGRHPGQFYVSHGHFVGSLGRDWFT